MQGDLYITGDPEADGLLNTDPLALLIGMLLDQQVPMEWAFGAPPKLKERLGGSIDAGPHRGDAARGARGGVQGPAGPAPLPRIDGQAHPAGLPAPRRAPRRPRRGPVGGRRRRQGPVQAAQRAAGLRQGEGEDLHGAPRQAVRHQPDGWEEVAAPFSDAERRSIADVSSPATLLEVRAWKKAKKARRARARTE